MATTVFYDSSGNIVFTANPVGSPNQQVSDTLGNLINPAKEDGNLLSIKTDLDQLTFTSGNLNVNIASGVTLTVSLDHTTDNLLIYGNDGTTDRKILTDATGKLQVGITNATLAVTQSGSWTVAATQSGTWNITNISGTVSLPTGASTEATLAAIKTDTDKLTFTATRLLVDGSGVTQPVSGTITVGNATLAVTQSGTWTTGRTWTLVSGTDSVAAVQSGTWNVNNISGTISLPTGASTAAKQPALGTAGTASADVITVQGIASMTPLKVDGSGVTQPVSGTITANIGTTNGLALDSTLSTLSAKFVTGTVIGDVNAAQKGTWNITNISGTVSLPTGASTETTLAKLALAQASTTSGQSGPLILGAVTTAAPTYVTAQSNPLSLMTTGALRTDTSSWMGSTAPTVGSKTSANSIPIVIASDQAAHPVNNNDGAGTALTSTLIGSKQSLDTNVTRIATSSDVTATGTMGALNAAVTTAINGIGSHTFVLSGVWVGTIVAEVSSDNGTTYANAPILPLGGGQTITTAGVTANGSYRVPVTGAYTQLRVRMSAFTSGTATYTGNFSGVASTPNVYQLNAANLLTTAWLADGSGNAVASASLAGVRRLQVSEMPYAMEASISNAEYVTSVDVTLPTGGTETNILLFINPNASGKTVAIQKIICHTTVNTNGTSVVKVYSTPTTTANGAAATATRTTIGGSGTAVATPFTGPTVTSNGARILSVVYGSGTSSAFTTMYPVNGEIVVDANNKILITGTPTANNINVGFTIIWTEF